MQSKLLRVLEDRRVRPVGSEREVPIDLRFIFATNAELEKEVEKGRFRADLFFRINVMQIHLPPLKDREDDVQELATLFMRKLSQQFGMPQVTISDSVRAALASYDLARQCARTAQPHRAHADPRHVSRRFRRTHRSTREPAIDSLAEIERRHILAVLKETGGNRDEAARRLGISRKTIDRKFASWNA